MRLDSIPHAHNQVTKTFVERTEVGCLADGVRHNYVDFRGTECVLNVMSTCLWERDASRNVGFGF